MSTRLTKSDLLSIRAKITDGEALRRVTPPLLQAYLEATGWEHDPDSATYTHPETRRVIVAGWNGGRERLFQTQIVLNTLETIEGRSQLAIYFDILTAREPLDAE